jgi:hypothetical protein
MANKQTSVEWLEDMIKNMVYNGADFGDDYPSLLVHIEQAKQMEKKQIIEAYEIGSHHQHWNEVNEDSPERYYNENYGKDNG